MSLFQAIFPDVQAALLAALAAVTAPSRAAPGEAPADERLVWAVCTASSAGSATGRQWAQIVESTLQPGVCRRELLGGEAPTDFPDCWEVGEALGCAAFGPDRE